VVRGANPAVRAATPYGRGMRTVELLLDDELDGVVRALWDRLAAAGLRSLAAHPHPTNRPHVTLAAGDVLPAALDLPLPIPVTLDGAVAFEGRSAVLAWRVRPSPQLLAVQAAVWRAMADPNPLHEPGRWVPHVSLARKVPPGFAAEVGVRHGRFVAARSYDTQTRTVVSLR
jgi:hypothetical protein